MTRLGSKLVTSLLACVVAVSAAACGGGSHTAVPGVIGGGGGSVPASELVAATFTLKIPAPTVTSATSRKPAYISAATKSVRVNMTTSTRIPSPGAQFNVVTNVTNSSGSNPGAPCTGSGPWTCTIAIQVPPGSDTFTFTTYDASGATGNVLSQQIQTLTVTAGVGPSGTTNNFTITFDANSAAMTVQAAAGYCASTFPVAASQTVGTVGTSPVTFNASFADPAGKPIVSPGMPVLSVNGHTDTNGGSGYTITGTGGNVIVKVNQSTQSYTLQATNTSTSATINVSSAPANTNGSSDGLSFSQTLTYTFQSGPAPPPSFLADTEQIINSSGTVTGGAIHLWTVALGASDTITAYSTPTLASTNPGSGPDVDFPNDVLFDPNGDLLIANGGAGSPDFGNFACVPAGAIATGANAATVLTNNLDDPTKIALGTDSSVDLANGALTTYDDVEFVLAGTYGAASTTRDTARTGNYASTGLVALPATAANPSGSYAEGLIDGSAGPASKVTIKHPDGSTVTITDPEIAKPTLTYDPTNNQLVIVSDGRSLATPDYTKSNVQFWSVGSVPAKVKEFYLTDEANGNTIPDGPVASSADGHIAVIAGDANGFAELNLYDNTAARNKIYGSVDFGGADCATLTNYTYGGTTVQAILSFKVIWLSNTKVMVELYSEGASYAATSSNGLYIFDINQTQSQNSCDAGSGLTDAATTVKQTGFQHLTNRPYSAAFQP